MKDPERAYTGNINRRGKHRSCARYLIPIVLATSVVMIAGSVVVAASVVVVAASVVVVVITSVVVVTTSVMVVGTVVSEMVVAATVGTSVVW